MGTLLIAENGSVGHAAERWLLESMGLEIARHHSGKGGSAPLDEIGRLSAHG
jgi:hypothetical protein